MPHFPPHGLAFTKNTYMLEAKEMDSVKRIPKKGAMSTKTD